MRSANREDGSGHKRKRFDQQTRLTHAATRAHSSSSSSNNNLMGWENGMLPSRREGLRWIIRALAGLAVVSSSSVVGGSGSAAATGLLQIAKRFFKARLRAIQVSRGIFSPWIRRSRPMSQELVSDLLARCHFVSIFDSGRGEFVDFRLVDRACLSSTMFSRTETATRSRLQVHA